jgi:hypothetical protein
MLVLMPKRRVKPKISEPRPRTKVNADPEPLDVRSVRPIVKGSKAKPRG